VLWMDAWIDARVVDNREEEEMREEERRDEEWWGERETCT